MSAGEMSAGEMSAGEMSAGEMSAGEMSAGEMSAGTNGGVTVIIGGTQGELEVNEAGDEGLSGRDESEEMDQAQSGASGCVSHRVTKDQAD